MAKAKRKAVDPTVEFLGVEVPVRDYLTGHEWEGIEEIERSPSLLETRTNLRTWKLFVESRTPHTFDVEAAMDGPMDTVLLADVLEPLLVPFAEARRERAKRQAGTTPSHLTFDELHARKEMLVEALAAVDRAIADIGSE